MDSFTEFFRIAQVVLGIGLVIFVHELGHYLAARLCRVRVETFSLGIGPRVVGWRRGSTMYQIALLPLGGYCRMAGEERRLDGLPPAPDELPAKSVGARFFIYSGGVLMNVAFALVVFPILFSVGVPFLRPVLGPSQPGSPAWHAGLPPGTEVLAVNGEPVYDFLHIPNEVALGSDEVATLRVREPGSEIPRELALRPERDPDLGVLSIGVGPDLARDDEGHVLVDVEEGSAAWAAGLRGGDRVVGVVDGMPGADLAAQVAEVTAEGGVLRLAVRSDEGPREVAITPRERPDLLQPAIVGIRPPRTLVGSVRSSPVVSALDVRPGDRLVTVQGVPVRREGDLVRALLADPGPVRVRLERDGTVLERQGPALTREEALGLASDLDLRLDVERTVVLVNEGYPASLAGMRDGDRIAQIDRSPVSTWRDVTSMVAAAEAGGRAALFIVDRAGAGGESDFVTVRARAEARPSLDYGFSWRQPRYVYRTTNLLEAVRFGAQSSWRLTEDIWLTLKGMIMQRVPVKSMGGIISIGKISYNEAAAGWVSLFFFLCLLSINLAFINVLPIPVLDGGHLFFLVVEKIKGSPVSDRVLGYSQLIGVVLILSLMVFVTYNDLVRWVFRTDGS